MAEDVKIRADERRDDAVSRQPSGHRAVIGNVVNRDHADVERCQSGDGASCSFGFARDEQTPAAADNIVEQASPVGALHPRLDEALACARGIGSNRTGAVGGDQVGRSARLAAAGVLAHRRVAHRRLAAVEFADIAPRIDRRRDDAADVRIALGLVAVEQRRIGNGRA